MTVSPEKLAAKILELAEQRGSDKTICPSEVARKLGDGVSESWRELMPDPGNFKGVYRIAINDWGRTYETHLLGEGGYFGTKV